MGSPGGHIGALTAFNQKLSNSPPNKDNSPNKEIDTNKKKELFPKCEASSLVAHMNTNSNHNLDPNECRQIARNDGYLKDEFIVSGQKSKYRLCNGCFEHYKRDFLKDQSFAGKVKSFCLQ